MTATGEYAMGEKTRPLEPHNLGAMRLFSSP